MLGLIGVLDDINFHFLLSLAFFLFGFFCGGRSYYFSNVSNNKLHMSAKYRDMLVEDLDFLDTVSLNDQNTCRNLPDGELGNLIQYRKHLEKHLIMLFKKKDFMIYGAVSLLVGAMSSIVAIARL